MAIDRIPTDMIVDRTSGEKLSTYLDGITVNVKAFGAKGDGTTNDTVSIQNAIDYANTVNANVSFDYGKTYKIANVIIIRNGVNVNGNGAVIQRTHDKNVNAFSFALAGNNVISNLVYMGGSDIITVAGQDYTLYEDFCVQGDNVTFRNCTFDKSCGSFISNGGFNCSKVRITECTFGNYLDHGIYFAGRVDKIAQHITVTNNKFYCDSVNTTRTLLKFRNNILYLDIIGNTVYCPNATFVELVVGDSSGDKAVKYVNVIGNAGEGLNFAYLNGSSGSVYTEYVNINSNTFKSSYSAIWIGITANTSIQNGALVNNVNIIGNSFDVGSGNVGWCILNGDIRGKNSNINIVNNVVNTASYSLFQFFGNNDMVNIVDNIFTMSTTYGTSNAFVETISNLSKTAYLPTVNGTIFIRNNKVVGNIHAFFIENGTNSQTALKFTAYVESNTFISANIKKLAYVFGAGVSLITTYFNFTRNKLTGVGAVQDSSFNAGYLLIISDDGIGTTANRPTVNLYQGFRYFDTTLNKPIWRNTANNGWVDATGATV